MASMHHTTNHGTILSANDIFMNVSKRPMSPVPMPPSSVGPKSNAKLPHAMSASTLAAPALLKRFSTKIADFMNKEEYKDYIGEVKDFLSAHGGPHKGIELSMFRTLFMKEMELDIQLPVAFDNPKKCVVSKDSAFLAVWSTSELSMISVVRKEVLFKVNQFDGIMGVFISPDSLFFVVAERSNIRIFSMIDQKECFNLVAHGAMSINPFEAVDMVQKNNVEFSRIKFSFFEAIEEVHPDRTSIGEGEKLKYKLIIGDRTLIYVLDIKVMDIGVKFVVDAGLDTFNLQDYYLIDSAEYIFTYQDEADKEKYVVAITESKGDTRFRRYLLTADYSDARDEKGNHNKVKLKVDLEHLFSGSMTFQHADSSPFRTGNHTVLVFNTDTKAVYICMLSTPFGFVGAAGTHTLSQVMIGFSKKDFRQLIINQKGDHLVSNHDDWELNVWRKDQEWGHYFTDRSSSDEFTMFMTPDDHFLIMKSKEGLKFLPLGFEKKERNTQVWLPDTMDNMLEKHYFRYVNSDNIIVFDTSSAFLTNFANTKHQFKHMLDPRLELTNPRIEDICPIRGTNEYWILIKEDSFAGSYYKLFLYNSSTGVTQESKAQILSLTVKITFNFDGRFVYLGDGQDGALSQVDTVRVFAYDDMKELYAEDLTCKCVAINSTLYVIKQDKVKIVKLETFVVSEEIEEIDTKFALYDVGLATKTYPELDYIIIYDFASLSLFDTAKNQFTGAIKFEGQNNHKSPFKNELLAITKDKQYLIAADQFTGNVMFYSLPDFIEQYNISVDPFDFLCVSPDSNYVFMADEFNKVILVYSISEMQVRTKISTQFEFLWTGTNLQYVGFEENTHSLALYYQRQNCVTQVLVPFSYTMIFNAFFRIYPLFLRFFGTDSYRAKEALMSEILLILENSNSYVPQLLQVFTIAIYLLDQPGFFKRYAEKFLSVDELCEKHNIWRLVFNTYKVNSVQCFKEMLTEYIVKNQRFPYIDEMSVREFILERNIYLNNTLYRWLLQKILFWRMDEEILGELNNPTTTVAYLEQSASKSDATRRAIQSLLKKQPNNLITFNSTETLVGLDFGNGSEFSATFFDIVDGLPESDIRDYYYVFVQYKWNKIYKFALIYSIVYWMMNIMAYIFNGFYFQVIPLGITLSVMNILFLLFELKCAMADYRRFFSSPWNWIDLTIHTFSIITIYIILGTSDVNNSMPLAWVRVVTVFVLSFRGITMLRVFKQTRYLISMLLQVLNDVVPFIIVLIFVLLIYIYVWFVIVYYGTDAVDGNTQPNYYDSIQLAVFTFFGQFPTDGLSTFQFVMIAIGSVLLALTLGNFIIALITSTYERISDDRQLFDAKDVIAMISDFDAFLKGIIKRRSHIWKNYVAIFPKYERSEDLRKTIAAIDNSKAQVLNVLEMSNHRYSELESKFNKMQNEVKEQVNLFEARLGEKLEHIHRRVEDALGMTKLSYSIDNFGK